jgi:hypothetical protein
MRGCEDGRLCVFNSTQPWKSRTRLLDLIDDNVMTDRLRSVGFAEITARILMQVHEAYNLPKNSWAGLESLG